MKYAKTLISAASFALLTGCGSTTSIVHTDTIQAERPLECRVPCLMPPSLELPREQWEGEIVKWGAECAEWHKACVDAGE